MLLQPGEFVCNMHTTLHNSLHYTSEKRENWHLYLRQMCCTDKLHNVSLILSTAQELENPLY